MFLKKKRFCTPTIRKLINGGVKISSGGGGGGVRKNSEINSRGAPFILSTRVLIFDSEAIALQFIRYQRKNDAFVL